MKKPLALFYAATSILLLSGISISLSFRKPWPILFFIVVSILFIGSGFVLKARLRRKQEASPEGEATVKPSSVD